MLTATFRFYEELNDFLTPEKRRQDFPHQFAQGSPVKDIIESIGVPHTEIDLILVNKESVDFSYQVKDGDFVSVYPMFEAFDIKSVTRLRPEPLRVTRFVLDVHLGKLTKYLRLLGFDTAYAKHLSDSDIIILAKDEKRIILTRDIQLLKNKQVTHGYFIRQIDPLQQIIEVIAHFDLSRKIAPFTRCLECNGVIHKIDKSLVKDKIPPRVYEWLNDFYQCDLCQRIYWQGTHYEKLKEVVDKLKSASE